MALYRRTAEFGELNVPKGLLKAHQTKPGVWGKIVILAGQLQYTINEPETEIMILDQGNDGVIEPQVSHQIKPLGQVRFYVEFYR